MGTAQIHDIIKGVIILYLIITNNIIFNILYGYGSSGFKTMSI